MKKLLCALLVCLFAAVPAIGRNPHGGLNSGGLTPPLAGFTIAFDDEFTSFNGDATGSNGWMTQYNFGRNNPGTGESQCYMDSSVGVNPYSIVAGGLQIQAALATTATPCGSTGSFPYTSGLIQSSTSFFMEYGYFEMRALLPGGGQGYWPAFWMLAEGGGFPPEIDEMENLGNNMTTIYQNVHFGTSSQTGPAPVTVTDASMNYHTYAVDWEPTLITFYVDGVQTNQYSTPADMHQTMYVLVDLAIGGSFPGNPDGTTTFPSNMIVKYVRAWKGPNSTGEGGSKALGLILFGIRGSSRRRRRYPKSQRVLARAA